MNCCCDARFITIILFFLSAWKCNRLLLELDYIQCTANFRLLQSWSEGFSTEDSLTNDKELITDN